MVPYPRCVGRTGSSCDIMMDELTAVLDRERGMRGIELYGCARCAGLFELWRGTAPMARGAGLGFHRTSIDWLECACG
jgi:hypothetical protein